MCIRKRQVGFLFAIVFTAAAFAGVPEDRPERVPDPAKLAPVHTEGAAAQRAIEDALRAFLREDVQGLTAALKRAGESTRLPTAEEDPAYPYAVVKIGKAFDLAQQAAVASAEKGDMEKAFTEFYWVLRVCMRCHVVSREAGIPIAQDTSEP